MSPEELAEAVNTWLYQDTGKVFCMDGGHIRKFELGTHRWPRAHYRRALRAVLGVSSDVALGFHTRRMARESLLHTGLNVTDTVLDERILADLAATSASMAPSSGLSADASARTMTEQALSAQPVRAARFDEPECGEEDWDMRRRGLITGIAALGVLGWGSPAGAEALRHDIAQALADGMPVTDVGEWERIAWEYGTAYTTTPPRELLRDLAIDLTHANDHLGRVVRDTDRATMRTVIALLGALVAQTVSNLGDPRTSVRWWGTAMRAADTSGDPNVRVWVRGQEIIHGLYDRRPGTTLLDLADQAEAISGPPGMGSGWVAAGRAQVLALAGRVPEAIAALDRVRDVSERLPASVAEGDPLSVYAWPEVRLRHTESFVWTYTDDAEHAAAAQERAIAMHPDQRTRGCAQVRLHQALHLVRQGDTVEGARHARRVVAGLPVPQRSEMVLEIARHVVNAVPAADRGRPEVAELRDVLTRPEGSVSTRA